MILNPDIQRPLTPENKIIPCKGLAISCVRTHLKNYLSDGSLTRWFSQKIKSTYEPFYSSIDIRDAGFKIAPVDANLFPAGFNNICDEDLKKSAPLIERLLLRHLGFIPKKIAILPERHTRNRYYADNLIELRSMFLNIGISAEVGWWDETLLTTPNQPLIELQSTSGQILNAYPFWKSDNKLLFSPFEPEFILLNNDFSSGLPKDLLQISQKIEPSPKLGWHTRKKSNFFLYYNELAEQLAKTVGIDPWHLTVKTKLVNDIDFGQSRGLDHVAAACQEVLEELKSQYLSRGINEKPFVFVKNNAGTYGMGIIRVEDPQEILELNRREKNKMSIGKNNLEINDVIVQEGIPTRYELEGGVAEPVIYLLGQELMGGFLRQNPNRGKIDNLNSQGMVFQKLCLSDLREEDADRDLELELVYGTIAQLSAAAIANETEKEERYV